MTVFVLYENVIGTWATVGIFTDWAKARSEQSRLEVVNELNWECYMIQEWDVQ